MLTNKTYLIIISQCPLDFATFLLQSRQHIKKDRHKCLSLRDLRIAGASYKDVEIESGQFLAQKWLNVWRICRYFGPAKICISLFVKPLSNVARLYPDKDLKPTLSIVRSVIGNNRVTRTV